MRCSVCGKENRSAVCPDCGFDSSRDYGRFPSFGPVREAYPASAARQAWEETCRLREKERKRRRRIPWILAALVLVTAAAVVGIWLGMGMGAEESGNWEENLLRRDIPVYQGEDFWEMTEEAMAYSVLGSEYRRDQIRSVTFLDTLKNKPRDAWDVSMYSDGSVMAWVKPNGTLYDLYIAGSGGVNARSACAELFAGYCNMEKIRFADAFHTDGCMSMNSMFWGCMALTELDVSSFDTSSVRDMDFMFYDCYALRSLDLSTFRTGKTESMYGMFALCSNLEYVDLESFETGQVTDMGGMFAFCESLRTLNLSHFDTSAVKYMNEMFYECVSLTRLDLEGFDMSSVQESYDMFTGCPAGSDWDFLLN